MLPEVGDLGMPLPVLPEVEFLLLPLDVADRHEEEEGEGGGDVLIAVLLVGGGWEIIMFFGVCFKVFLVAKLTCSVLVPLVS